MNRHVSNLLLVFGILVAVVVFGFGLAILFQWVWNLGLAGAFLTVISGLIAGPFVAEVIVRGWRTE